MNLAQLDLNLLVALRVLLEEKNVTRAGQQIGLSQPAMSGALARLRALFDDPLLIRTGQTYELSPRAKQVVEPVRTILRDIERVLGTAHEFDPATAFRHFVIVASDSSGACFFQRLVERLQTKAPGVTVQLLPLMQATADRVTRGSVDLVVTARTLDESLLSAPLFEDQLVCVVWKDHPTVKERLSFQDFLTLPHVTVANGPEAKVSDWDREFERNGVERKVVATVQSLFLLPFAIEGTPLVGIMPRQLAERFTAACALRVLDCPWPQPPHTQRMYWHAHSTTDSAHQWLRTQMVDLCRSL